MSGTGTPPTIVLEGVSKWYGEVLGVNRINLTLPPGITSLVGPNGSGKSTLMNLMTGLLRPSSGRITVLGLPADRPEALLSRVGYCPQYDGLYDRLTGEDLLVSLLRVHGFTHDEARRRAGEALERVGLVEARGKKVGAYSKGMRQRIKLALALAHRPEVLILDEPLNGLDPMVRFEVIGLFKQFAGDGLTVIISSHILDEVDLLSSNVVMINHGYVVAEGDIQQVRQEITRHPMQIYIRCDKPAALSARLFTLDHVVSAQLDEDRRGLLVRTLDADRFYLLLNQLVLEQDVAVEMVTPADDSIQAVYDYLIGDPTD